jgi:hypothetical protein
VPRVRFAVLIVVVCGLTRTSTVSLPKTCGSQITLWIVMIMMLTPILVLLRFVTIRIITVIPRLMRVAFVRRMFTSARMTVLLMIQNVLVECGVLPKPKTLQHHVVIQPFLLI